MDQKKTSTMELPLEVIQASAGFALYTGESTTTLVYRSKEDFNNGEPIRKTQSTPQKGHVKMVTFPSENMEDIVSYIQTHCDIYQGDDTHPVYFTGASLQPPKVIEEKLQLRMKFLNKFYCYSAGLHFLLKNKSLNDVFKPVSEKGKQSGDSLVTLYHGFKTIVEGAGKGELLVHEQLNEYNRDTAPRFPAILTICESDFDYLQVEEDGRFRLLDSCPFGGTTFHGLSRFMTGLSDPEEISSIVEQSSGETVDTFADELVDGDVEDDPYSDLNIRVRLFPFGKAMSDKRDRATPGDLMHSLLQSVCEICVQIGYQVCQTQDIENIYFCGQFASTPKTQQFLTGMMHLRQHLMERQVNYEFLQNGEYLGALGGFIEDYRKLQK